MSTLLWLLSTPFRILGSALLLLAFAAGMYDIWRAVEGASTPGQDGEGMTPLGKLWFDISPDTLNLAQAAIQRGVHPAIWDPGIMFFLGLPAWLSLFLLAALALLIAQLIYRPR